MTNPEAQLAELEQSDCEKVFREQVSSVAHRAQLEAALDFIREGDTLIVSKLDRLGRELINTLLAGLPRPLRLR